MSYPYIGDRQLDPPAVPDPDKCWSCKRKIDRDAVLDCDSHCPKCGVEIDDEWLEDCMPDLSDPGEPQTDPADIRDII